MKNSKKALASVRVSYIIEGEKGRANLLQLHRTLFSFTASQVSILLLAERRRRKAWVHMSILQLMSLPTG